MTTNLPPEPDEFQTRMRPATGEGDVEDTSRGGSQPAPQQPAPPQPAQPQFAPPGFGSASQSPQQGQQPAQPPQQGQPAQPPAGYGQPQPGPPPAGYGAPQPTQSPASFGQQSQAPQGQPAPGQAAPSFGQQSQAPNPWGQQQGQQPGGFGQQQPGAGYPQGGFGQQQGTPWGAAPQRPKDANPLKAAFDFSFGSYATPGIVKIVYIVGIVLAVIWYLMMIIGGFQLGAPRDYGFGIASPGSALPGILAILLGWIPAAFFVLVLRLALEQVLSSVRTATDVRVLRQRSDEDAEKTTD